MAKNHDIKGLEKKIDALSNALAKLGNKDDFKQLILILRKPGWTTPAEFLFASAIVDSMTAEVKTLTTLKTSLIKGSKEVVAVKRAAA
ncbi:MAG: hypothetical protein R2747_20145 [Pyrinomonadaceae bacterium]